MTFLSSIRNRIKRKLLDVHYELQYNYLSNKFGAFSFRTTPSNLNEVQRNIVDSLKKNGFATVPFNKLLQGEESTRLLDKMKLAAEDFIASEKVRQSTANYEKNFNNPSWKEYVVKIVDDRTPLNLDHFLVQLPLQSEILDTVNEYLGLYSKLNQANFWYTIPIKEDSRKRAAAQQWHRDPEDRRMVKVFLYFTNVDKNSGALEYIPSSRPGGKHFNLWPETTGSGGYGYPPQDTIERVVQEKDKVRLDCSKGTLAFVDTSGLHRGGFAKDAARVLGIWSFVTPASPFNRKSLFVLKDKERIASLASKAQKLLLS